MADSAGAQPADEVLLAWSTTGRRLRPATAASDHVDVADSWLVRDGMVRGLEYHLGRFIGSCRRYDVDVLLTSEFLAAVCAALPVYGRWFPRVEFEAGAGLRLRLRRAPEPGTGVVLSRVVEPDRRSDPVVKGPDLALLAGLRRGAAAQGADEVLLVSSQGTVLEGALSAALWWRGDVLCAPPLSLPVLPSVTRRLLLEIAAGTGTEVRFEACRVRDLDGTEIWTASALHGIRPVTAWPDHHVAVAGPGRVADWQALLAGRARPVHPAAAARGLAAVSGLRGPGRNLSQAPAATTNAVRPRRFTPAISARRIPEPRR